MKLDGSTLGTLASVFAQLSQSFAADNPGQAQMAAGLHDSSQGIIAAEAAKKERKRQEKEKRGGILGTLGRIGGAAIGSSLGGPVGGAIGAGLGGAAGDSIGGRKLTAEGVISDAISGGLMSGPKMGTAGSGIAAGKTVSPDAGIAERTLASLRPATSGRRYPRAADIMSRLRKASGTDGDPLAGAQIYRQGGKTYVVMP